MNPKYNKLSVKHALFIKMSKYTNLYINEQCVLYRSMSCGLLLWSVDLII